MREFAVAAERSVLGDSEDVVTVPIDGVEYIARRPTVAQIALLNHELTKKGSQRLGVVYDLVESLLGEDARLHVQRLVWQGRIEFEDLIGGSASNPDGGLIDLIIEEFTGRPTEPSTDSSASQSVGGRRSTGRLSGEESIPSVSDPTDFSTSSRIGQFSD